jgi:hypothetical protein
MQSRDDTRALVVLRRAEFFAREWGLGWAKQWRDVLDVTRATLSGEYDAGQWASRTLALWTNAAELFVGGNLDAGLTFVCDEETEAVGPRYVEGHLPPGAPGVLVDVEVEPGPYHLTAMVRAEEPGILTVTFVGLSAARHGAGAVAAPLPPGTYHGRIEHAGPCRIVRRGPSTPA